MTHIALEQQARDLLERAGVEDAQRFTAGDLVEIANLLGRVAALAAPVEPVAQPVDARLEYRRNILEGISNWLVSRSNTVWAEKHGYTNLMKSWGQDLRDIDAALSATQPAPAVNERIHAPAAPAVPDGWVMVPREPTPEMRRVGADVWHLHDGHLTRVIGDVYRAMIAAAPGSAPDAPAVQVVLRQPNLFAADPAAPAVNCEWTNCPRRVGDVCCNDRPAAPAVPAVDCRTCGRHNACVNTYDEDQDCFKADRYQPLPPVKLWRAA